MTIMLASRLLIIEGITPRVVKVVVPDELFVFANVLTAALRFQHAAATSSISSLLVVWKSNENCNELWEWRFIPKWILTVHGTRKPLSMQIVELIPEMKFEHQDSWKVDVRQSWCQSAGSWSELTPMITSKAFKNYECCCFRNLGGSL